MARDVTTDDQLSWFVERHDQLDTLAGLKCDRRSTVSVRLIGTLHLDHLLCSVALGTVIADHRLMLDRSDVGEP